MFRIKISLRRIIARGQGVVRSISLSFQLHFPLYHSYIKKNLAGFFAGCHKLFKGREVDRAQGLLH